MEAYTGVLQKMATKAETPVNYELTLSGTTLCLNKFLGKTIHLSYNQKINCLHCGKITKKSFSQGYCYPCFITLPQTDASVINPELNQAHLGISRNMKWSQQNDLIDHYVYLSVTSDIKVGVTRHTQVLTRWMDQGAEYAIIIAKTPYRQLAGQIEVSLKSHFQDKTNWRKMLQGSVLTCPDLVAAKTRAWQVLPASFEPYYVENDTITAITYPILRYPTKITSLNFDTQAQYTGTLMGIKGQYLLFEDGTVLNVRKFGGYNVTLSLQ